MTTTTPPTKKRKTLHDYFSQTSAPPSIHKHTPAPASSPPSSQATTIPGLTILPTFISPTEETSLLTFLSTQKWRTDLSRRTIHYGGTYCLMPPRNSTPAERKEVESTILTADPMPSDFAWLIDRMIACGLYSALGNARPEFCIVYISRLPESLLWCMLMGDNLLSNEYVSNHGISAHVENFRFVSPIRANLHHNV